MTEQQRSPRKLTLRFVDIFYILESIQFLPSDVHLYTSPLKVYILKSVEMCGGLEQDQVHLDSWAWRSSYLDIQL